MRSVLIQRFALRSRTASVASSLNLTRRLQSSWTPALPAGQSAAYDEAVSFLAKHKERKLEQLSKLQENLAEVKEETERSQLQREVRKAEVEAWVNDPETRELFESGAGDMSKEVFRWLAERKWRKEGSLDLLMQRLLQMNVVPDLIPSLFPSADLKLSVATYSSSPIEPGSFLPPSALSQPPQLSIQVFHPDTKHYTLLMLDPDSPDIANASFTTKIHWILPNIQISPSSNKIDSSAPALLEYVAPEPEKGTPYHRYTFLAFEQPEGVSFAVGGGEGKAVSVPEKRTGFDMRGWLKEAGLDASKAVGANMVRSVWSDPIKAAKAQSTSAVTGKLSYSTMSRRSMVASSSRPQLPISAVIGTAASARAYSWTPWKSSTTVTPHEAQEALFPVAVTAGATDATPEHIHLDSAASTTTAPPVTADAFTTNQSAVAPSAHEPILQSPHPDLLNTTSTSTLSQPVADASLVPSGTFEQMLLSSPNDIQSVLQSPEAIHAALKVSDLKLAGLEHGWVNISGWMRDGLVALNQMTGLPWWLTIAAFTLSLRLAIFPFVLRIQAHNARMAEVQPQFAALMAKSSEAKKKGDPQMQTMVNTALQTLMREHNVHPLKGLLLPVLQMPLFFSMFWALQGLAGLPLPMLKEGGFSWVTDLTLADPYYILPTTSMLLTLGVLEIGGDGTGGAAKTRQMAHFKNAFRVGTFILIPFVGSMPAAILFYWTFSNGITLLQATLLKAKWFRNLLGLPLPPVVPLPPGGIEPPPTMKDTWKAFLDAVMPSRNPMFQAKLRERQRLLDEQAIRQGRKTGMGEIQEFVQEKGQVAQIRTAPTTEASGQESAWLEDESRPNMARAADDARKQRVAAARERRSRPASRK